jgi:hypothetical protein
VRGPGGALVLAALLALAPAAPVAAQDDGLARVEALLQAGRISDARERLARWRTEEEADASGRARARALLLEARLTTDPAAAEASYLGVVYGYPASPEAAEALLRLGQGALTVGEPVRAVGYLERLVRDYPGTAARGIGLLWLARAQRAGGLADQACATAVQAVAAAEDALLTLAEAERAAACASDGAPAPLPPPAGRPGAPPGGVGAAVGGASEGAWSVQVGAFSGLDRARSVAERLEGVGFGARVVRLPDSRLVRVRVGRYGTRQAAEAAARAVVEAGFEAMAVGDARDELPPAPSGTRAPRPSTRLVYLPARAVTLSR